MSQMRILAQRGTLKVVDWLLEYEKFGGECRRRNEMVTKLEANWVQWARKKACQSDYVMIMS